MPPEEIWHRAQQSSSKRTETKRQQEMSEAKERQKPFVTIVTVTYNAEEHLEKTIKSVINQNYKNI